MAEGRLSDDELCDIDGFLEGLDPDLINVLRQSGEIDDGDIEVEMLEGFSKEEISNARVKIFECAKQKAARWLRKPNAGGIFGPEYGNTSLECGLLSAQAISQWELVPRRKKCNFAKDTLELLAFSLVYDAPFPAKLVKGLSMNKGTFETLPDNEDAAIEKLSEDIEQAEGRFSVEIVNTTGDTETHIITISPNEEIAATESGENAETDRSKELRSTHNEPKDTEPKSGERKPGDPLFDLVSSFVEMSEKMLRALSSKDQSSKTAYQYRWDYTEKLARDTDEKMKDMIVWQRSIEERMAVLENRDSVRIVDCVRMSDGHDSDSIDERNEPPIDAVSQRLDRIENRPSTRSRTTAQNPKVMPVVRKQYPARNIHHTPDPRIVLANKKGNPKPDNRINVNVSGKNDHIPIDENPYTPLERMSEASATDNSKKKTTTRGRGRGRKQTGQARPGPSGQQPPTRKEQSGVHPGKSVIISPDLEKSEGSLDKSHENDTGNKPSYDITTSWYDDDDELADQSAITTNKADGSSSESSDDDDSDDQSDDKHDGANGGAAARSGNQAAAKNVGREKGRKRTSTREAPMDFLKQLPDKGKSTAPANKKPKLENKYSKGKKITYAEASGKDPWTTSDGKKNKRMTRANSKLVPELKSAAEAALKEVYIQELDCSTCNSKADFERMVLAYCKKRGLYAVDACTIPVKNSRTKSGCKLTVHDSDYDAAMSRDFWPRGSMVRPWTQRPRGDVQEDDSGSHSE